MKEPSASVFNLLMSDNWLISLVEAMSAVLRGVGELVGVLASGETKREIEVFILACQCQ